MGVVSKGSRVSGNRSLDRRRASYGAHYLARRVNVLSFTHIFRDRAKPEAAECSDARFGLLEEGLGRRRPSLGVRHRGQPFIEKRRTWRAGKVLQNTFGRSGHHRPQLPPVWPGLVPSVASGLARSLEKRHRFGACRACEVCVKRCKREGLALRKLQVACVVDGEPVLACECEYRAFVR
jgi:hypothetical protein